MLILTNAGTDKLQMTRSTDADIDVHVSWVDVPSVGGTGVVGKTNTAFASAATGDIVATPAASTNRVVKHINARNKDTVTACDVTMIYDQNGTDFELHKVTLNPGELLEYQEGIGWFKVALLETQPIVFRGSLASDVSTGANTTPVDVTGLVFNFEASARYVMDIYGPVQAPAATTGMGFQLNTSVAVTTVGMTFYHQLANTGTTSGGSSIADDASVGVSSGIPSASTAVPVQGSGYLVTSGAGSAQLRVRSETTAVVTVMAGFMLVVTRVV